jgi:O-antigen/teichoic acid export membrane protein
VGTSGGRLDARRLPVATVWRFTYLAIEGGLSLLLYSLLAHVLRASAFAPVAVALGVLTVAQALGDLGLSQAAVSVLPVRLARAGESEAAVLAGAANAYFAAACVAGVVALLAALAVPAGDRLVVALVAPATAAAVIVAGADGLLRAVGEFRRPAALVSASRVGGFAGLVGATSGSAATTMAAISAGTVLASLPAAALLLARFRASRDRRPMTFIRAAAPLGASQLFVVAGGRLNTVLLAGTVAVATAAGFESAWRLFQLAQYLAGGVTTAAAPFIADALGHRRDDEFRSLVGRLTLAAAAAGLLLAAGLLATRRPLADALFGTLGPDVARAVVPLALVTPFTFVGFVATVALAVSSRGRATILAANGFGAVVNVILVIVLGRSHGVLAGTIGASCGLLVAALVLIARLSALLRRPATLRSPGD